MGALISLKFHSLGVCGPGRIAQGSGEEVSFTDQVAIGFVVLQRRAPALPLVSLSRHMHAEMREALVSWSRFLTMGL